MAGRAASPEEAGTVRLAGHRRRLSLAAVHDVHAPQRLLGGGARTPRGRDGGTPLVPLGLDEEVGECGMCSIHLR